jgi:hypothetical protein
MPLSDGHLRRARESYTSRISEYRGQPQGASDGEFDELQAKLGFALPTAYQEFLGWMGRDDRRGWRNALFSHDRVFIADVSENEQIIDDLLRHEGVRELASPRMLVWWVHEVYDSYHFPLPATSDDPICYRYIEGERTLRNVGKFSACLADMIKGYAECSTGCTPQRHGRQAAGHNPELQRTGERHVPLVSGRWPSAPPGR